MYWTTGILGIVLVIAPFIFGYNNISAAAWTSYITGTIIALVSLIEGLRNEVDNWEYWIAAIVGLIAIGAPFVLGFSNYTTAMWSSITIGALVALFAGSGLYMRSNK